MIKHGRKIAVFNVFLFVFALPSWVLAQSIQAKLGGSTEAVHFSILNTNQVAVMDILGDGRMVVGTSLFGPERVGIQSEPGQEALVVRSTDAAGIRSEGAPGIHGVSQAFNQAGVIGETASDQCFGIKALNTSPSGGTAIYASSLADGYAIQGHSDIGYGVTGVGKYGVFGKTGQSAGRAVYGWSTAPSISWAGYFLGRGYFSREVGIRTDNPSYDLHVNGSAGKPGGGSWTNASDIRLKNLDGNYTKGLKEVMQLQPILFHYKANNARGFPSEPQEIGFVAQDVQKVFPEAVSEGKDGYLDLNLHAVNVALVNAVKELRDMIRLQDERIRALESELAAQRSGSESHGANPLTEH